jgi:colanic acid/amylovoran biosynthesis glycosyltransferase
MYPRPCDSFVVTELLAGEAAGEDIQVFSLRPPGDSRFPAGLAAVHAPVTYLRQTGAGVDELWASLRDAAAALPHLGGALPDLLRADATQAAQALELALAVHARGIRWLHAHFAAASTVTRLASLLTGVPYSLTAHAEDLLHADDLRPELRDAQHVVAPSAYTLQSLGERFGPVAAGAQCVYPGVDVAAFPYTDPDPGSRTVVAVGRMVATEGFDVLVDACAVARDRGTPFRCVIVGSGPTEAELRARLTRLDLHDHVKLAGARPLQRVSELIASAAVLAAPYVAADSDVPAAVVEAMAVGTPCVSTGVAAIPEVVREGDTGLVVPQDDPVALADALVMLLDDRELRTYLARRARALVETEFDAHRQAAVLHELRARRATVPALA